RVGCNALESAGDTPAATALSTGGTPVTTVDFVFSFCSIVDTATREISLALAPLMLFWASQSWPQKENPAHEKRFSAREHNRSRMGPRLDAHREKKRRATFTT